MCRCGSKDNLHSDDEWHPSAQRGRVDSGFSVRDNRDINRPSYWHDLQSPQNPRSDKARPSRKAPGRMSNVELTPAVDRTGRLRVDSRRSDRSRISSDRSRISSGRSRTISYYKDGQSPNHLRVRSRGVSNMTTGSQGDVPQLPYQPQSLTGSPLQHSFNTPTLLGTTSSRYRNPSILSTQTDTSIVSNTTMSPHQRPHYNDGGFVPRLRQTSSKYGWKSDPPRPRERSKPVARRPIPFTSQRRASTQQQQIGERSSNKYKSGDLLFMSTDLGAGGVKWHQVKLLGYFPKTREWKIQFHDRTTLDIVEMALHDEKSYRVLSNNSYTTAASDYGGSRNASVHRGYGI